MAGEPGCTVEVAFRHCAGCTVEAALPHLLEKHLSAGRRAAVRVDDPGARRRLDAWLWTYDADSFLPHAAMPCEEPALQPVLLMPGHQAANGAEVLVLLEPGELDDIGESARVELLFGEKDGERLAAARGQWTAFGKRAGVRLSYWRLAERGAWERVR